MDEDRLSELPEEEATGKIRAYFRDVSKDPVKKKEWKKYLKFAFYATILFILLSGPWTDTILTNISGFGKWPTFGLRIGAFFILILGLYYFNK
jgi:hypothetical protein